MTTAPELAAALEAGPKARASLGLECAEDAVLLDAARLLRALDAVRLAAAKVEYCNRSWARGHGPNGLERDAAWAALRTALRGVGGGV